MIPLSKEFKDLVKEFWETVAIEAKGKANPNGVSAATLFTQGSVRLMVDDGNR